MTSYRILTDPRRWLTVDALTATFTDSRPVNRGDYAVRGVGTALPEMQLKEHLLAAIESHGGADRAGSDVEFSLVVREVLPLTRREASDPDLWFYLNATVAWPYVVWRWTSNGKVTRERVRGGLARSALGRLWWMAELTRGRGADEASSPEEHRERLAALLRTQDMAVQLYERPGIFARPRTGPELLRIAASGEWSEDRFREFARMCSGFLGTRLPSLIPGEVLGRELEGIAEIARRGG